MNKLIIAGSRGFNDYKLLSDSIHNTLIQIGEVVSGTAKGADALGEIYATNYNIPIKRFPADWNTHGKSAGYIRNEQMAKYATHCIVFWDGESRGTKHMIDLANKYNLKLTIVKY